MTTNETKDSIFGEVIYAYTRAQAIEDRVLIDVTETAKEAGIVFPTAVTPAVWAECVKVWPSHTSAVRTTGSDRREPRAVSMLGQFAEAIGPQ